MAVIKINHSNVIAASGRCDNAKHNISAAKSTIYSVGNQLDNNIKCRCNIDGRIKNICASLDDISNRIVSIKNVCVDGANRYKNVDAWQRQKANAIDLNRINNAVKSISRFK